MKIDNDKMKKMAQKSDNEMWAEILSLAKAHGYDLSGKTPTKEELEKIRRALSGVEKISLSEATRLINNYKKKQ